MMERIEDETIRYLFFLRIEISGGPVPLPYPEPPDEDEEEEAIEAHPQPEPDLVAVAAQREAEKSVLDLTRNIQRKKEKELAALQFAGDSNTTTQTASNPYKNVGRNDPCPCGSGKKYKKCHGA
jgi:preprotein translocase subunit SecA